MWLFPDRICSHDDKDLNIPFRFYNDFPTPTVMPRFYDPPTFDAIASVKVRVFKHALQVDLI